MTSLDTIESDFFAPLVGQIFQIETPIGHLAVALEAVKLLGHRRPDATREPFALGFRGARAARLPQGIYRVIIPDRETLELFITQNSDGPQGTEYEAIFN